MKVLNRPSSEKVFAKNITKNNGVHRNVEFEGRRGEFSRDRYMESSNLDSLGKK